MQEINVTKEQFKEMYMNLSNSEIQQKLDISYYVLTKYAKLLGLKKRCGRRAQVEYKIKYIGTQYEIQEYIKQNYKYKFVTNKNLNNSFKAVLEKLELTLLSKKG